MQPKLLKYILDIEAVIQEIEVIKAKTNNDFARFSQDMILLRATERNLEIIGEAVKKIIDIKPSIEISATKNIIGLRNIIAHAYDTVEPELLWGIIQNNIPILKKELSILKSK